MGEIMEKEEMGNGKMKENVISKNLKRRGI